MTILFAYDGSESADVAISTARDLLGGGSADAVVLSVWEPLVVEALRSMRFGGRLPMLGDVAGFDAQSEDEARQLAEHGARLIAEAGFEARPLWVADSRAIADTIVEEADELDVDLIVLGARGLTGISRVPGQRVESCAPELAPSGSGDPGNGGPVCDAQGALRGDRGLVTSNSVGGRESGRRKKGFVMRHPETHILDVVCSNCGESHRFRSTAGDVSVEILLELPSRLHRGCPDDRRWRPCRALQPPIGPRRSLSDVRQETRPTLTPTRLALSRVSPRLRRVGVGSRRCPSGPTLR